MTKKFNGILVPLTTPFHDGDGEVDFASLRDNARALLERGASGVLVAGSTGEAPLLSRDEAKNCVSELRATIPDDRWLIVGTGRESTRATIEACRDGAEAGADAALVRAPSYFAPSIDEPALLGHFAQVADASPIPVLLYNMPKYTHVNFSVDLIGQLAGHENIVGAKDSSGDLENFRSYREVAPDLAMLVGSGAALLGALESGAAGGIVAVANFACELAVAVVKHHEAGENGAAAAAQESLGTLHREIVAAMGPAGVKSAMDAANLFGGKVRSPLSDLDDVRRATVESMIQSEAARSA